jgi:hypothetical protein
MRGLLKISNVSHKRLLRISSLAHKGLLRVAILTGRGLGGIRGTPWTLVFTATFGHDGIPDQAPAGCLDLGGKHDEASVNTHHETLHPSGDSHHQTWGLAVGLDHEMHPARPEEDHVLDLEWH